MFPVLATIGLRRVGAQCAADAVGVTTACPPFPLSPSPLPRQYVSCNAKTMLPALERLSSQYAVRRFALLDLFPYTEWVEVAVHLSRRDLPYARHEDPAAGAAAAGLP
jgi:hypothetical protein